jgi:hypothetical protein
LEVWPQRCQESRVIRVGNASPSEDLVAAVWEATV